MCEVGCGRDHSHLLSLPRIPILFIARAKRLFHSIPGSQSYLIILMEKGSKKNKQNSRTDSRAELWEL